MGFSIWGCPSATRENGFWGLLSPRVDLFVHEKGKREMGLQLMGGKTTILIIDDVLVPVNGDCEVYTQLRRPAGKYQIRLMPGTVSMFDRLKTIANEPTELGRSIIVGDAKSGPCRFDGCEMKIKTHRWGNAAQESAELNGMRVELTDNDWRLIRGEG